VDTAQQTLQELLSGVAPQLAADQVTQAGYQAQLGAVGAETGLSNAYAQSQYGISEGELGISEAQLGLQGQGLAAQEALAGQQQGIEQQQYGLQMQQFPEEQTQAKTAFNNNQQALAGGAAASGALGTKGTGQQEGTQVQNYGFQQADISRAQQQAVLGQQSELAGYGYQQGQFGRAQENLALMAQSNGLSQEQLVEQLNYGISQNNLQGQASVGSLLSSMGSLASGDISTAGTAIAPIAYAGGVNPLAAAQI
jgi:hypothetical protein